MSFFVFFNSNDDLGSYGFWRGERLTESMSKEFKEDITSIKDVMGAGRRQILTVEKSVTMLLSNRRRSCRIGLRNGNREGSFLLIRTK